MKIGEKMSIISLSLPTDLLEELDSILGEKKTQIGQKFSGKLYEVIYQNTKNLKN